MCVHFLPFLLDLLPSITKKAVVRSSKEVANCPGLGGGLACAASRTTRDPPYFHVTFNFQLQFFFVSFIKCSLRFLIQLASCGLPGRNQDPGSLWDCVGPPMEALVGLYQIVGCVAARRLPVVVLINRK